MHLSEIKHVADVHGEVRHLDIVRIAVDAASGITYGGTQVVPASLERIAQLLRPVHEIEIMAR